MTGPVAGPVALAGPALGRGRTLLRRTLALVASSDLALLYGGVVTAIAVALALAPAAVHDRVVLDSSTNLANLRDHPLYVLLVSGFVVSDLRGLWLLPWLLVAYALGQRWLGRAATAFVAALGHVASTVFVAVLLTAGVVHGRIERSVARAPDVGVSYGLACLSGLLVLQVPRRARPAAVALLVAFFVGPLLVRPTFTDLGHATALTIGLGIALVVARATRDRQRG